ncbi:MAG: redoxin domain-containing protein [Bacteroidetes bacterium]|nr:redoxin domain-containing protein [Bacteroidota bacterium]
MKRPLLLLSTCMAASLAMAQASNYPNGSTVDDFTVTDTQGQVHNLNDYAAAGKYVLLDFFFYNCGPCQAHAPYYSQLYQTYGCNGGNLICIEINNGMDNDALTEAFSEDFAPGYAHPPAVGSGGGAGLTTTFGVGAFPTFCLIGPDMQMIANDIWPVSSMQTFVNEFPAGSNITPQQCSALGVDEAAEHLASRVWPVPSNGLVHVELGPNAGPAEAELSDASGRLVGTRHINISGTLDLQGLEDGNYILELRNGQGARSMHRITLVH